MLSAPVARFASKYCNAHTKNSNPWRERHFNAAGYILWKRRMHETMRKDTAKILHKAWKAGKIPEFVEDWIDIQEIVEYAED